MSRPHRSPSLLPVSCGKAAADGREPALASLPTRASWRVPSLHFREVAVLTCAWFTSGAGGRTMDSGCYKSRGPKAPRKKQTVWDSLTRFGRWTRIKTMNP